MVNPRLNTNLKAPSLCSVKEDLISIRFYYFTLGKGLIVVKALSLQGPAEGQWHFSQDINGLFY